DPERDPPQGRRQHRRPRDPLHPRPGRLAPPLRRRGRRDHRDGQAG
ncbi:MAG: LSU ribosomal protein L14p (L23e), partial [uncultured Gemmatimonadaceae bacterium]